MTITLERRVQLLTALVVMLLLVCAALTYLVVKQRSAVMDELTVKRINIVDETGTSLRLVLSNEHRQHPGRSAGKDFAARARPAGLLFFNNEGDECGGLVYSADRGQDGSKNASTSLTMDQYHNDQVVQLYNEENIDASGKRTAGRRGLAVNEIPMDLEIIGTMEKYEAIQRIADTAERRRRMQQLREAEGGVNRVLVGRSLQGEYGLFLADASGRPCFRICLDAAGQPRIQVIDSLGKVHDFYHR